MSVTGLLLKYTSLRIVYVPSGSCPSWCARGHDTMEDLEERRRQRYRRRLSDEKRQYDSERGRLARQQQSESLRSLTACARRDRQRIARHRSRQTSPRNNHSIPLLTPFARTTLYQSSFFVSCVPIWNHLPESVISAPSSHSFKVRHKTCPIL